MLNTLKLLAPLRVSLPFFTHESFRPKTNITVTYTSVQNELQSRLGNDTYQNAVFVRRGAEYLIVLKGKVCGTYSPVLCLPPPLPHCLSVENFDSKEGFTVRHYLESLQTLDSDYRSLLVFSMEHGMLFYLMGRGGTVPEGCKLLPTFMKSRFHNVEEAAGSQRNVSHHNVDDTSFSARYSTSSQTNVTRPLSTSHQPMMQAGDNSQYFRDVISWLNTHKSDIDQCSTLWRRVAVSAHPTVRDIPLLDRLLKVSRAELKVESTFDTDHQEESMDDSELKESPAVFQNDKRWVPCPATDSNPTNIVHSNNDVLNEGFLRSRVQRGFLKLDF